MSTKKLKTYMMLTTVIASLLVFLGMQEYGKHQVKADSTITIGVYPGYDFPADIDSYTALAGRKPDVVYWFQSWSEPLYYSSQMTGINARGVTPQITWSPGGISLSSLNSGSYDSYITSAANAAKSYGKPMQIRLAHEFNGPWQTFCPCVSSQTNAQFITFWRHVVDTFRSVGANNVQWVWSPNVYLSGSSGGAVAFDGMYPGDSYVDWVGLDGYNFGPPNNAWQSLITVFKPSYTDLAALTTKPLMIAEWGSTEAAGDKAAWIRQGFLTDLPAQMPRVRQVDIFDRVAESDFRINSSATALSAYKDMVNSPIYGGPQPTSGGTSTSGGSTTTTAGSQKSSSTKTQTSSGQQSADSKVPTPSASNPATGTDSNNATIASAQSTGQQTPVKTKDKPKAELVTYASLAAGPVGLGIFYAGWAINHFGILAGASRFFRH